MRLTNIIVVIDKFLSGCDLYVYKVANKGRDKANKLPQPSRSATRKAYLSSSLPMASCNEQTVLASLTKLKLGLSEIHTQAVSLQSKCQA